MTVNSRLALVPIALVALGAAPADQYIPVGKYNEAIVIPARSPVRLKLVDHDDRVIFSGKLVVEGTWVLDCDFCEPGQKDNELHLSIVPDASTLARLPHWKRHDNDIRIDLSNAGRFIRSVTTADERQRILAGTLTEVRGHAAIVVDQYEATLECDAASYSARFVSMRQVATRADLPTDGDYGCGYADVMTRAAVRRHARS